MGLLQRARGRGLSAFGEKLTTRDAEAMIGEIDNSKDQRALASYRALRHERGFVGV
jgi:hypothetical protein